MSIWWLQLSKQTADSTGTKRPSQQMSVCHSELGPVRKQLLQKHSMQGAGRLIRGSWWVRHSLTRLWWTNGMSEPLGHWVSARANPLLLRCTHHPLPALSLHLLSPCFTYHSSKLWYSDSPTRFSSTACLSMLWCGLLFDWTLDCWPDSQ